MAIDTAAVRSLYNNTRFTPIFDYFAGRNNRSAETTVVRLRAALNEKGFDGSREELVDFLRSLEQLGCGKFILGRQGHPSRFRWSMSLIALGKTARGNQDEVEVISGACVQPVNSKGNPEGLHDVDERGNTTAMAANENVVLECELRLANQRVQELELLLGKKILEVEILQAARDSVKNKRRWYDLFSRWRIAASPRLESEVSSLRYEWVSVNRMKLSRYGIVTCAKRADAGVRVSRSDGGTQVVLFCRPVDGLQMTAPLRFVICGPR